MAANWLTLHHSLGSLSHPALLLDHEEVKAASSTADPRDSRSWCFWDGIDCLNRLSDWLSDLQSTLDGGKVAALPKVTASSARTYGRERRWLISLPSKRTSRANRITALNQRRGCRDRFTDSARELTSCSHLNLWRLDPTNASKIKQHKRIATNALWVTHDQGTFILTISFEILN